MASSSSSSSPPSDASTNGTPFFLPATAAQGLANYPHARVVPGNPATIYVSGTSSRRGDGSHAGCETDAATGRHTLDIRQQTAAVLRNIDAIVRGATGGRAGVDAVVDATVFLTDMAADYAGMNEEWNKVFPDRARAPARTTVQVAALPSPKLNVEIKCTALMPPAL